MGDVEDDPGGAVAVLLLERVDHRAGRRQLPAEREAGGAVPLTLECLWRRVPSLGHLDFHLVAERLDRGEPLIGRTVEPHGRRYGPGLGRRCLVMAGMAHHQSGADSEVAEPGEVERAVHRDNMRDAPAAPMCTESRWGGGGGKPSSREGLRASQGGAHAAEEPQGEPEHPHDGQEAEQGPDAGVGHPRLLVHGEAARNAEMPGIEEHHR